jgi:MFS transporter, OFA family, oxalate/formate antiporter
MIWAGKMEKRFTPRIMALFCAVFFSSGYLLAGFSKGNFVLILLGIGFFVGMGTGLGYLVSLTVPVKWFPERKGLITGISAAGFGLGAMVLSVLAAKILNSEKNIFDLFKIIGFFYGFLILFFAFFLQPPKPPEQQFNKEKVKFLFTKTFSKLFMGMLFGTFAGLMVIGSLKIIGGQYDISSNILILGVSLFAVSNFAGRLFWGVLSDYTGASLGIFFALLLQAGAMFFMGIFHLNNLSYIVVSLIAGFSFGGNFVLFAKETAQVYGSYNLAVVYPYVFLGYGIAGITGPITGGFLYDHFNSFLYANIIAATLSLTGGLVFYFRYIALKKHGF